MQQSKTSKTLSSLRPRSAGMPRSAGTTRTKSFFEKAREGGKVGNNENIDVTDQSFLESNDELIPTTLTSENEDAAVQFSLLGNLDCDNDICEWEATRTIKPRDAFVNDMQVHINLFGTGNVDTNSARGIEMDTQPEISHSHDESPPFELPSLVTLGPIRFFLVFWDAVAAYLLNCYSSMTRFMAKRNYHSTRQVNEDGLVSDSQIYAPIVRASNIARVEDRLQRELELEGKLHRRQSDDVDQELATPSHYDEITAALGKESNVVVMDKSYWTIPGQDLVGPKRRSGNVQSEVELTIDIGHIKFSHNQVFNAQEKSLARVSCLYDQYRLQMEANTFRTSVTKVTEIFQQLRFIHDARETSGKLVGDSRSVISSLFNDLKSSTVSLVAESESIKNKSDQMKQCWNEFLSTREDTDSYYDDVVLKASLPYSELNDDLKKLAEEMKSTKPVLSRMSSDEELLPSSEDCSQILQNLESIVLSDTNHITELIELVQPNSFKDSRKLRIEKAEKYFARLLVNGHVVGDTKTEQLDRRSFTVGLSHRFSCLMLQKPTNSCVQLWKATTGFLPDVLICTCYFIIQDADAESSQGRTNVSDGDWLQFASKNSDVKGMVWLATRAVERAATQRSSATRTSNIPMHNHIPVRYSTTRLIKQEGLDIYQRRATLSKPRIRPCPDRQSSMEFKHSNGILFSNKMIFEEPLRHVLIQRRQKKPSLGPTHIPITELEVQNSDAFHDTIKNDVDSSDESIVHDAINERPYVNKLHIIEVMRRIRECSQRSCVRKYHFSEVIQDVSIYRTFPQVFSLTLPPKKRSLYPTRTHFLPVMSRTQSSSLLLTVIGGRNVPRKMEGMAVESSGEEVLKANTDGRHVPNGSEDETCAGVLVKIRCRGNRYQTKLVDCGSSSPQWKETFCIPLCEEIEDVIPSDLLDELVHFSLFDSTAVDLKHIGGFYEDEDSTHSELRYLGHVSFPLGVVLREGKLNGFIHCHSPFCVVGYNKGIGETNENESIAAIDSSPELYCGTMLHIHMTTEPFTIIPPYNRLEFPSVESEFILSRLTKWAQNQFDVGSVLWLDSGGRSNIASRFVTEQTPPPGFDTLTSCANFVRLIPSVHLVNWKALKGRDENMTLTSQHFINIMVGTRREHAILLTNFFLFLSNSNPNLAAEVLVVVGCSVPEGTTTFVLRRCRKTRDVVIWDAMTGRAYPQTDNSCPLQKIHCLVSKDNIYRNVETDKMPCQLDFDISNVRKWAPLHIDGESKNALLTAQVERLHFALPDHLRAREMQIEICDSIQSSIRGWRHTATCFRTDINAKLASKLEQLEHATLNGIPMSNVESTLNEGMMKTRMTGFILHEPFISVQEILDRVKATEIHRNGNPRVEYAIAARVFAYPGGCISVWVCVCSVTSI